MSEQTAALTLNGHDILFPPLPYDMGPRMTATAENEQALEFVNRATRSKDQTRKEVCPATFGAQGYQRMRELSASIKAHTLDHLDYYLEQFIDSATASGTQVHFAASAKQANEICLDIAKRNESKLCVKSKSMVTEETHLVPALEGIGCETVETDLGEFIIQLDNDAPSHIVTPMIHKDRTAVARAFVRELNADYTEDPTELTQIAHHHLRAKFRQADLGISGGNFLVADTGSVVICTNEGNGRLCTSAPRVHVAFVGIEKLVPSKEHLGVLLKMLARSSTGQPLTVYTHIMSGPKRTEDHDGPEEMHVILVDNGRSEILREETRDMLRCIRCGACLNACPVYRKVTGHSYGAVYSGPIGALITPMFKGLENYKDLPNASSLCGACYEACPVKIDIPKYLIKLRNMQLNAGLTSFGERITMRFWAASLKEDWSFRLGWWGQKLAIRALARWKGTLAPRGDGISTRGWLSKLPGPVHGWTSERDLPTPTASSFRQWWARERGK